MRRVVLRALAGMVYGGLPPQRPDQVTPAGEAGVAPGTRSGNLRARSLVLSGTGNGVGLFEYSGAPGPGNPPIAFAAPPGVTRDPFGNLLPVTSGGFAASNSSNGQFGILQNAALLLGSVNVSTRIIADAAVALLDALADNMAPGIAITAPSTPTGSAAQINILGESKDASKLPQIVMGAPIAAPSTTAFLEVQSKLASVSGGAAFLGSGEAIFPGVNAQLINAVADILLTGASAPVVAGRYRVYGTVTGINGGIAATQAVGLSTTAGVTAWDVDVDIRSATANSYKAFGRLSATGQRVGTGALAASEVFIATYRGLITFSGPGNLNLTGSCVTAATDTWSVNVPGTELAVCQR